MPLGGVIESVLSGMIDLVSRIRRDLPCRLVGLFNLEFAAFHATPERRVIFSALENRPILFDLALFQTSYRLYLLVIPISAEVIRDEKIRVEFFVLGPGKIRGVFDSSNLCGGQFLVDAGRDFLHAQGLGGENAAKPVDDLVFRTFFFRTSIG